MILDGSTYYQAYDMTRIIGIFIALILTIMVETGIIFYFQKRYNLKGATEWLVLIVLVNMLTFFLGTLLFLTGV